MARDNFRDELEGLFKAAADDPSLEESPAPASKRRGPPQAPSPAGTPPLRTGDLARSTGSGGQPVSRTGDVARSRGSGGQPASGTGDVARAKGGGGMPASAIRGKPMTTPGPLKGSPSRSAKPAPDPRLEATRETPHADISEDLILPSALPMPQRTSTGDIKRATATTLPPELLPPRRRNEPLASREEASRREDNPSSDLGRAVPGQGQPPSRNAKQPKLLAQRQDLEMVDYAPDEPLVDHRGRAKPLYKPTTPRPKSWRPSKPIRLLLGLFPGTRVMALESVGEGWPFTLLGVIALLPALFLLVSWSTTAATLRGLAIADHWMLAPAATMVLLFGVFELLRLGSFLSERTGALRMPRVLATFTVPALAILIAGPELIGYWPRLVEAVWCAGAVLALGGIAGTTWCVLEGTLASKRARRIFQATGGVILVLLVAAGWMTQAFSTSSVKAISAVARAAGFRIVPDLLGHIE